MMTVTNEINNMGKYKYLLFVEFLDFLCRIALGFVQALDSDENRIEDKVSLLFKMLGDKLSQDKTFPAITFQPIDEEYEFEETENESEDSSSSIKDD